MTTFRSRAELAAILKSEYFTPSHLDGVSDDPLRYVAVADLGDCYQLADFKSFEDAAEYLADGMSGGWQIEAVYDLDSAERIGLHVSTPIVTRSEDQGVMVNPLDAPDHEIEGMER